jgi:hypothetical protein
VSRAGFLAVAVTLVLAAGATAAFSLTGRRAPAARPAGTTPAAPVVTALRLVATPATVTYGDFVRVTGRLRDAAGAPLPGRSVEVVAARLDAPDDAAGVATPMTDGRGAVSASFAPTGASTIWLRFAGAAGLAETRSDAVRVGVAPRVSLSARTVRKRTGWVATLRGAVRPRIPGDHVRLDRRDPGGWTPVAVAPVGRDGAYAFTIRRSAAGTYRYRVVRPADSRFALATARYDLRLARRPAPLPPLTGTGGPGQLLVTGDSFAYYLGQQLAAARRPRPTTVDSRHSSGLARPDYFDWVPYARRQVKDVRPRAVVVFLGANDCQPIRAGGTGRWVTVGSAAWIGEYRRRAGELMRIYTGDGARPAVWVGLPIAKRPDIASCYRAMNAATAAAARDVRRVTWVDSWTMYAVDGRYSDYVHGVLARQEDGIHLTFAGTRLLTRRVFNLLGG